MSSAASATRPPVEIRPETRRYLYYERGMTDMQYNYLVQIGAYVSVGDHSEFEAQKVEQQQVSGGGNAGINSNEKQ